VEADDIDSRPTPEADIANRQVGMGRELFAAFRDYSQGAEQGAGLFTTASLTATCESENK
jgi:phosphogluconate dehydratase